ncbi:MAG: hypothetical protein LBI33_03190 [Propionibacteriaceae bacterium]|jgi:hypothetical protein|nr:hypothetical protein [Propionibacteriaceae bacterium]
MSVKIRPVIIVGMVVAVALVVGGCSQPSSDSTPNPYAAEFAAARAQTDIPEVREVLADDVITDAEYLQIIQLIIGRVEDLGFSAEYMGDGGFTIGDINNQGQDAMEKVWLECVDPIKGPIDLLYFGVRDNPDNRDVGRALFACYQRFGVADERLTFEEFQELGRTNPSTPLVNFDDPDALGCMKDPFHYAGDSGPSSEPS